MSHRKMPVHLSPRESFNRSVIVYVTACTQDRKQILARPDVHELLRVVWTAANDWLVGRYVLMPDHIHLFCAPRGYDYPALKTWVQFWKSRASLKWPRPEEQPIWQKSFWDTQLRWGESYCAKWEYVLQNPARKQLVGCPRSVVATLRTRRSASLQG